MIDTRTESELVQEAIARECEEQGVALLDGLDGEIQCPVCLTGRLRFRRWSHQLGYWAMCNKFRCVAIQHRRHR